MDGFAYHDLCLSPLAQAIFLFTGARLLSAGRPFPSWVFCSTHGSSVPVSLVSFPVFVPLQGLEFQSGDFPDEFLRVFVTAQLSRLCSVGIFL